MLKIDFLYYDKTTCKRCASINDSVKKTLDELKSAMKTSKIKIKLTEKKLPESKINMSPSILINGRDIEKIISAKSKLKNNACKYCCQLIGHPVNCRTFSYKGKKYNHIPKAMIIEAINVALRRATL